MTDDHVDNWSGVEVFWDYDVGSSHLTIGVSGPAFLLTKFESPTEVMVAFMQAVVASDESMMLGQMDSIHTRFSQKGFSATWQGKVVSTEGRVPQVINSVTKALGAKEL
jgi:hypothetical protein